MPVDLSPKPYNASCAALLTFHLSCSLPSSENLDLRFGV